MNIVKMREVADYLLDEGKYEDAYYVYDEIYNHIWLVLGTVQNGLNEFSQSFLGSSFRSVFEFRNSYAVQASENVFSKWFSLDLSQTLNELTFTTYGHLQSICYSPELNTTISALNIYNEFLILHTLILENGSENWVANLLKVATPFFEGRQFKKLRPNYTEETVKKYIVSNAEKIKFTDWSNVNITFLDYLFNIGDKSSDLYSSVYKVVGYHFKQKTHREKTYGKKERGEKRKEQYERYEQYEKYERYERFEKHSFKREEEFNPSTATEFEKSKYYGKLLGLAGKVTKSQIRKNYLDLIAKYHPDKVFDLGEELKILAEKKTKQFNMAYEWMKKKYKL